MKKIMIGVLVGITCVTVALLAVGAVLFSEPME